MKKFKEIPKFKNEDEEFKFWSKESVTDYFDLSKAKKVRFTNLHRTTKLVAFNMPISLIDDLKFLAHKKDVPYQSLVKLFLVDRIEKELHAF